MSLLLDALDRADKERGQQLVTPSPPVTPTTFTANEYPIKRWVLEAVLVSLVLGLVLYAVFFRSSPEMNDSAAASTVTTSPTSELLAPEDTPIAAVQTSNNPIAELRQQLALPQEALPHETLPQENAEKLVVSEEKSTPQTLDSSVSELYQQQNIREKVVEPKPAKPSPALDQTKSVAAANPVAAESTAAESSEQFFQNVPLLSDLPTSFKRRVPSLKYSTHVYGKDTQTGFVNINGPFREVGSQVAPGIKLIAILPEGVVLELDGVLFRLRALNDWAAY